MPSRCRSRRAGTSRRLSRPRTATSESSRSNGTKPSRISGRPPSRCQPRRRRPGCGGPSGPCRSRIAASSAPRARRRPDGLVEVGPRFDGRERRGRDAEGLEEGFSTTRSCDTSNARGGGNTGTRSASHRAVSTGTFSNSYVTTSDAWPVRRAFEVVVLAADVAATCDAHGSAEGSSTVVRRSRGSTGQCHHPPQLPAAEGAETHRHSQYLRMLILSIRTGPCGMTEKCTHSGGQK